MKWLLAALFILSSHALGAPECEITTPEALKSYVHKSGTKRIIFFASWCADCKNSIQTASHDTVLVGVFDTKERIDRVYRSLKKPNTKCFLDLDDRIARRYEVKGLPFQLDSLP